MIKARIEPENPRANLKSYATTYASFSWSDVEKEFTGFPDNGINIVHEAIDRWCTDPEKGKTPALIFEKRGEIQTFSFRELKKISCQWANIFLRHGFKKGDRLFLFLPPCPELYFAMLACARLGILFCPLYQTLSFHELEDRIKNAGPKGIVTHPDLSERFPYEAMSDVEHLFLTKTPLPGLSSREVDVEGMVQNMEEECKTEWLPADAPLYLLYTSGSTGPPKGIVHSHRDMTGLMATAKYVLDLDSDVVIWTDGNPAWVTGAVYSTFAPWLLGSTSVVQGDPFSASTWYRTLERHKVAAWYTTPRTIRRLMEAGEDLPRRYDFSQLRHISTVGEALSPDLFYWARKNLKLSLHDTWWMTETGMICIANFPSMGIKPGSMGKPVPGVEAAVIDENGEPLPLLTMGELALKPGWPAMMTDIWRDRDRYQDYFSPEGWFLTGDMVIQDEEGYFYHQGRMDDLMKAGDVLIGPYEIEQVLRNHPAVVESAVISMSRGSERPGLKAFVVIGRGFTPSSRLNHELKAFVKANLPQEADVSEIEFLDALPKTLSGKLLRRVLRARELGLPTGDPLSMLD